MEWVGQGWELTIDEILFHWPGHPHASDAWVPHWVCPLMAVVLYPYHNFWFECIGGAKIVLNFSIN